MTKPTISLQELRERIGSRAKSAPTHRFWGLYVHIMKLDNARGRLPGGKAKPRSTRGRRRDVRADRDKQIGRVPSGTGRGTAQWQIQTSALPAKRDSEGGVARVRVISIPTIRDRVVHGALRLILEPIFEADFSESSYGARPGRSAHQAIGRVRQGLHRRKHHVVDVDLSRYFDCIRHDRILEKVAQAGPGWPSAGDGQAVLEERGEDGGCRKAPRFRHCSRTWR